MLVGDFKSLRLKLWILPLAHRQPVQWFKDCWNGISYSSPIYIVMKQTVTECEEAVPTGLVKCRPQEKQTIIWDKSNKGTIWVAGEVKWGWQHKIYQPPQPSKQREMKQTFIWSSLPSKKCISWLEAALIHDPLEATTYLSNLQLLCDTCMWILLLKFWPGSWISGLDLDYSSVCCH